jgi:cell division protease FtsH
MPDETKNANPLKPPSFLIIIFIIIFMAVTFSQCLSNISNGNTISKLEYSDIITLLDQGNIKTVTIYGDGQVEGDFFEPVDGSLKFNIEIVPAYLERFIEKTEEKNIYTKHRSASTGTFTAMLYAWGPILLIIGFWIFFMRRMQQGGDKAINFGKSKAKLATEIKKKVTFKDVAGIEEPKAELQEIIDFLKNPAKFHKLGGRLPKGVLLMGAPGTGKTLSARAVAGEADVPFLSISGSDFVEMFVGVGASRVRDLFEQGKKSAPCIVFIDEIDAVGRHRGAGLGGGHDEREQTLNQLLVGMDGFDSNEGVIIIAATNRPDVLDPALLRPGRFDRRIIIGLPDVKGRSAILGIYARNKPLDGNIDLDVIAKGTPGFSGADLENLINEAALNAARNNRETLQQKDFDFAKDKVILGSERKTLAISDEEKKITAIHEAGHALLFEILPETDPLEKVTIIPRGMGLGVTIPLLEDRYIYSEQYFKSQMAVMMGGRCAEMEFLNEIKTSGASNDFEKATDIATKMVRELGMSSALGPRSFKNRSDNPFLGMSITQGSKDFSEEIEQKIDEEIDKLINEAFETARAAIHKGRDIVLKIAEALMEKETIDGSEVREMIKASSNES